MKHRFNAISLTVLTLLAGACHLVDIGWGAPFFFHPDERNIAAAVSGMHFPTQLNPHFFAYGSLPIYTTYILAILTSGFSTVVTLPQAIILGRIISALLATALVPLVYLVGRKLLNRKAGLFAAALTTLSVGIIQFAHFATFEMWLTFFSLLLFWCCLKMLDAKKSLAPVIGTGIIFGVLMATKVSSLVLLPLCLLPLCYPFPKRGEGRRFFLTQITRALLLFGISLLVFLVTNPFVLLDFTSFRGSMIYESSVAIGTLPVFYTQEFIHTIPLVFQLLHVFPFLLSPVLELVAVVSIGVCVCIVIKKRSASLLLLLLFFLILLLSQAVLFVKWTRYMVPTLPFIYLMTSLAVFSIAKESVFKKPLVIVLLLSGVVFATAFLKTVYFSPDPRVAAATWAARHLIPTTPILSETYDLGIVSFNQYFPSITLFDFYNLDQASDEKAELQNNLSKSQAIILPSQRILKTRILSPKLFPESSRFYQKLTAGTLGFKKIYETPCPLWCRILYLGNPVFSYEETASVFDHPTVTIFSRQ